MGLQLILTHENTDFDGLASQLAAWKLYSQAWPILPRRPNRNLRDFLTLYWDELPYRRYEDLPRRPGPDERVERIILVDTQTLVTPRGMSDDTAVQIIDHHPLSRELPPGWTYTGEEVGATVTLLLEQILAHGLSVTPVEATLLALGIYEDTGSLAYPTTTVRDLRCATWLMEHGANLGVLSDFLHHPLTDPQLDLYEALLDSAEAIEFAGHTLVIATATAEGYVEEISTLAHKIRDLYDPAGLFLLVDLGEHRQLVARSTTDAVDVGHIAAHFGGGGHTRAAAALIRGTSLERVRQELVEVLERHIHPLETVSQIMSFGVHTLSMDATVDMAAETMLRYGFEGFPIVDDEGRIVGILTRREIDRAQRLRLGDMPVNHYMTKGPIQVTPEDSVERLQQVMTQYGVGQVPVVDDGEIVGVVTRTDLIKLWAGPPHQPPRRREIAQKIEAALPPALLELLRHASQLAQEMAYPLYVVGGFVRDLLLGQPTLDMDLVVEGNAIQLARRVARRAGAYTRSHKRFGTATVILPAPGIPRGPALGIPRGPAPVGASLGRQSPSGGGRPGEPAFQVPSLDFATARMEFYAHSAALPEVERSSIKADLHRRDFTINTLAIRLDSGYYGQLLDFYGGEQDLRDGLVRVLHSLSFIEDPTRMMRAARFEQRLGFVIESRTAELIDNALPMLARVTGERIRHELYLILREREPERALCRLDELGVLAELHPGLACRERMSELFRELRQTVGRESAGTFGRESAGTLGREAAGNGPAQDSTKAERRWAVLPDEQDRPRPGLYLALLTYPLSRPDLESLAGRLKVYRGDLDLLRQILDLRDREEDLARDRIANHEIYALLRHASSAALLIHWLCTDSARIRARLWLYETELRHVQPVVDGAYLKSLGLKPSPLFGKLLGAVRDDRLDGIIATVEEEKAMIARLLAQRPGG